MSGSNKKNNIDRTSNKSDPNLRPEDLPNAPEDNILFLSRKEVKEQTLEKKKYNEEIDAIATLAFLENIKSGQSAARSHPTPENKATTPKKTSEDLPSQNERPPRRSLGNWFYIFVILGSFFGTWHLLKQSETQKTKAAQATKKGLIKKVVNPKKINPRNARAIANNKKHLIRAKRLRSKNKQKSATPFAKSETFKKHQVRQLSENPVEDYGNEDGYDDEDFYDDGDTPAEQDPIRKHASKEIIDPEESYANEEDDYDDDDTEQRAPASANESWVGAIQKSSDSEFDEELRPEDENWDEDELGPEGENPSEDMLDY